MVRACPLADSSTASHRVSGSGPVIPYVDGLRFIAIAWVVLHHTNAFVTLKASHPYAIEGGVLPRIASHGFVGVQLFFVISGFILCLPVARRRLDGRPTPPLAPYYRRRLRRLEPPDLLSLVLL
jgi:peptidoglycan/LPS O-acetylase OafA/YrhL